MDIPKSVCFETAILFFFPMLNSTFISLTPRNKFIEDYGEGIIMFIDEYWRMIHRGAGYSALQVWLLVITT